MRLAEALPQERLTPVAQLPVRALDLPEELSQFLVTRLLGVLEVRRARVCPLEGVIEDADDVVMLISRAGRAFAHGPLPLVKGLGASLALPPPAWLWSPWCCSMGTMYAHRTGKDRPFPP